jgi:hypothetical protein
VGALVELREGSVERHHQQPAGAQGSGLTVGFAIASPVPWPIPPDWSSGVRERLSWLTDRLPPRNGKRPQKRQLRIAPRRGFDFDVKADQRDRRVIDAALFDNSGKVWALPIWHDIQTLAAALASGSGSIPCATAGFDFVAGGKAMLWRAVNTFEIVTINAIASDHLTLSGTTAANWAAGTRLYPLRNARLQQWPQESAWNDDAGIRKVSFTLTDPCDWPALAPAASYRGMPVLELRSDEAQDPTASYARVLDLVDTTTGTISVFDFSGASFRNADSRWLISDRVGHSAVRSLLYGLRGQMLTLWIPSWAADLQIAADMASGATMLVVDWCGYTVFGHGQCNRQDIRIELKTGAVLYRRITAWSEAGETEHLAIDAAPGVALTAANVRVISFMTLSEQASDDVEIQHETDAAGISRVATAWRGVKHDL